MTKMGTLSDDTDCFASLPGAAARDSDGSRPLVTLDACFRGHDDSATGGEPTERRSSIYGRHNSRAGGTGVAMVRGRDEAEPNLSHVILMVSADLKLNYA